MSERLPASEGGTNDELQGSGRAWSRSERCTLPVLLVKDSDGAERTAEKSACSGCEAAPHTDMVSAPVSVVNRRARTALSTPLDCARERGWAARTATPDRTQ